MIFITMKNPVMMSSVHSGFSGAKVASSIMRPSTVKALVSRKEKTRFSSPKLTSNRPP